MRDAVGARLREHPALEWFAVGAEEPEEPRRAGGVDELLLLALRHELGDASREVLG